MHLYPGVAQVQRVRMTLGSVADDRDLAAQEGEVAVSEDRGHAFPFGLLGRERERLEI